MFRSSKLAALLVAMASIAPLAIPVAASATATPDVQGNSLTVNSDAADPIIFTVVDVAGVRKIALNGVATTLTADANAEITVNAGGEVDIVNANALAAADYRSLMVNGGEGNDFVTGGANADVLNGDAGNDTLTGGKGNDTANGGTEDDTMIWNNGDGTDVNNGGDGNDAAVSNGNDAAGEVYTYGPGAAAGRVQFNRAPNAAGAGAFGIDLEAESLVINSLGGDDQFSPTAAGLALRTVITVNAGAGNDSVTGGDGVDVQNGDAGNDTLIGGKGNDTANGGADDDTMIWNNGDGTDTNTGDAGNDTVLSNGNDAAGEVYTYGPGAAAGRVQFNRAPNAAGAGAFGIDLEAENFVINSLGGNDQFNPTADGIGGRTTITVNAGEGNDAVTGGDGTDIQNGDAGNDTLVGGKGVDTANGGDGDDTMIWNNGDGTDKNTGNAGTDTVVSNGNDAANEVYTYGPGAPGRVQFNRLPNAQGAGAFGIDLEAERFFVNGLGGNDKFSPTAAGLAGRTAFTINAGAGNDVVTGGDGADDLHGDGGDDQLFSRDGVADFVHGDAGQDSAQTDALTLDKVDGVEKIDALGGDKKALLPLLGKAKVVKAGKKLFAQLRLTCPAAEIGGCNVRITLKTAKAVRLGKTKRILVLGSKSVKLAPGAITTVKVPLGKRAARVAKGGKLSVKALITSTDAAGNKASTARKLALKLPRTKK